MRTDELDTLFAGADPAADVVIPSGSSAEARWRFAQLPSHLLRRDHTRRRLVITTGVLLPIAAALVLVLVTVLPGPSAPTSAAAAVLEQAAASAAQPTPLAPGQYLYTETETRYQMTLYNAASPSGQMDEAATAQFTQTQQAWTNAVGGGPSTETDSAVQFSSAADQAAWNASPSGRGMSQELAQFGEMGGGTGTGEHLFDVANLPTDVPALTALIANGAQQTNVDKIPAGPTATFERAAVLLIGPTLGMTPALASALFGVLANQPGVSLLGTVRDHNGQPGDGVTLGTVDGENPSEVIVDPTTGALLEAQFALPAATLAAPSSETCEQIGGPSAPPTCQHGLGESILAPAWSDVVSSGVVDSDTATVPPVGAAANSPTLVPGAPTGLVANVGSGQATLSWTVPPSNGGSPVTDYAVRVYDGASTATTSGGGLYDTHTAATSYTWPYLTDGQTYTFTVQAISADGYGPLSNSVTVTVAP